jgi:hypothetical protein
MRTMMMRMVSVDILQITLRILFCYGVFTPKNGRTGSVSEPSLVRYGPSLRMIDHQSSFHAHAQLPCNRENRKLYHPQYPSADGADDR